MRTTNDGLSYFTWWLSTSDEDVLAFQASHSICRVQYNLCTDIFMWYLCVMDVWYAVSKKCSEITMMITCYAARWCTQLPYWYSARWWMYFAQTWPLLNQNCVSSTLPPILLDMHDLFQVLLTPSYCLCDMYSTSWLNTRSMHNLSQAFGAHFFTVCDNCM